MVKLRGALGPAGREGSGAYRHTEVHKTRIKTSAQGQCALKTLLSHAA